MLPPKSKKEKAVDETPPGFFDGFKEIGKGVGGLVSTFSGGGGSLQDNYLKSEEGKRAFSSVSLEIFLTYKNFKKGHRMLHW